MEVWEMFVFLHGSRPTMGLGGPGLIPLTEYLAFFALNGIDEDIPFYSRLLRAIDRAWLTRFYRNRGDK